MRKGLAGLCGLCLMGGLLAGTPLPRASARASVIDKELLGVRLLQNYKAVLQAYGAPTRVYRGDEYVELEFATDLYGKQTGGVKGLGGSTQNGATPGGGGMPGSGGPMGMPGGPGGFPSGPMGMPSSGGPMGVPGSKGGGGAPLGGASGTSDKPETFAESGGYTWAYYYPRDELAYVFRFNNDGRVEIIEEHGRYKGKPSSRGIRLGDGIRSVYGTYGWPDTIDQQVGNIALNYNLKHHIQISTLNGKVVSMAVFLKEDQIPHLINAAGGAGGGGGARPGGGGRPSGGAPLGGGGGRPGGKEVD